MNVTKTTRAGALPRVRDGVLTRLSAARRQRIRALLSVEAPGARAGEFGKLMDQVGLVGVGRGGPLGPICLRVILHAAEQCLKARYARQALGRDAHPNAHEPLQMAPADSALPRHFIDPRAARRFAHRTDRPSHAIVERQPRELAR